ncbi:TPA: hypothetical protein ACH3X1_016629 [Trebouxia sp. C0004]
MTMQECRQPGRPALDLCCPQEPDWVADHEKHDSDLDCPSTILNVCPRWRRLLSRATLWCPAVSGGFSKGFQARRSRLAPFPRRTNQAGLLTKLQTMSISPMEKLAAIDDELRNLKEREGNKHVKKVIKAKGICLADCKPYGGDLRDVLKRKGKTLNRDVAKGFKHVKKCLVTI